MEAKNLVGKLVVSDRLVKPVKTPKGAAFKVVGYKAYLNLAIIDAKQWGWSGLDEDDVVVEKCETYWYIRPEDITKVL